MATAHSLALVGLRAVPISIDVDVGKGRSRFVIVGLPDAAVRESRDRVKSAVRNAGYWFPADRRTVVSLSPADLRKQGPAFDLPIALGILAATGQAPGDPLRRALVVGELSLEGGTRPVSGCLPMAAGADARRFGAFLVPRENASEAATAGRLPVYPIDSLSEAVGFLADASRVDPAEPAPAPSGRDGVVMDFADVRGQEEAKRVLTVAAAGHHHALLVGPPGTGKTMLARRLPGILPEPDREEILEAAAIHSVAGLLEAGDLRGRPFRAPHHTVSAAGLLGGGPDAAPGEISLAHTGVLMLDELPEFDRRTLNGLRQPLEAGCITIRRCAYRVTYPSRVLLVGAMNPCPCGRHGDGTDACRCSPREVSRYVGRVSGPLLDRIDLHLEVSRVAYAELTDEAPRLSSDAMGNLVRAARERQTARLAPSGLRTNADIPSRLLGRLCRRTAAAEEVLGAAVDRFRLSARAHARVLRLARTIADLADRDVIDRSHVGEALGGRGAGPADAASA